MIQKSAVQRSIDGIRSAAKQMKTDSKFKVVFEETQPFQEDDFLALEEWIGKESGMEGFRVAEELRAIYSITGGFRFQWQYLPGLENKTVLGSAELVTPVGLYHGDDEADKPMTAIYQEPRRFDVIGQDEYVAINFSRERSQELPLTYFDEESRDEQKLPWGPVEYLQSLSSFLARYGWQKLHVGTAKDESIQTFKDEVELILNLQNG